MNDHLLVSPHVFDIFVSLVTGIVAATWVVVDIVRLRRALADGTSSRASVRDRVFGSVVGILIGAVGIVGVTIHHLGHHV